MALAGLCRLPSLVRRPALRHWLWLLVLVKLVTPPLVAVPLLPAVADLHDAVVVAAPSVKLTEHRESAFTPPAPMKPAVDEMFSARAGRDLNDLSPSEPPRPQALLLGGLVAVSLIGTCLLLAVQAVHAVKLYRWIRRAGTATHCWLSPAPTSRRVWRSVARCEAAWWTRERLRCCGRGMNPWW